MTPAPRMEKVIAVLRSDDSAVLPRVVPHLVSAGISEIELTMTTPGALRVIEPLRDALGPTARIGMGTITTRAQARDALAAGAQFLVTPGLVDGSAAEAHKAAVPIMIGAFTPTEVMAALESGADRVKLFPAGTVTAEYLRQLRGPLPSLCAVPSGGIDANTARSWLDAGAVAVAVGGPLLGDSLRGGSISALQQRLEDFDRLLRRPSGA